MSVKRVVYTLFFVVLFNLTAVFANKADSLMKIYSAEKDELKKAKVAAKIVGVFIYNYDSAVYYCDKFISNARKAGHHFGEAYAIHMLGSVCVESSRYEEAKRKYNEAISLYKELKNDTMIAKVEIRLAFIYYTQADYETAAKTYLEAIELARRTHNVKIEAWAYNLLGLVFYEKPNPDYRKALNYYTRSFEIYKMLGEVNSYGMVQLRIGSAYTQMEDYKNAEYYLNRALASGDSLNDIVVQKWTFNAFSLFFKKQKEFVKSNEIEKRSRALSLIAGEYPGIIISYKNVAENHFALKRFKEALVNVDSAVYYSVKYDIFQTLPDIYELKSTIHNELKETDLAFTYYKKAIHLKDSLFSVQNSNNINELETKFQTSEKEKSIELLNSEKESDRKVRNVLLGAFIVALVLIALVVFVLIKINKARKEIAFQKKIVDQKQKEMVDSINYAKKIQKTLMPTEKYIEKILNKHNKN